MTVNDAVAKRIIFFAFGEEDDAVSVGATVGDFPRAYAMDIERQKQNRYAFHGTKARERVWYDRDGVSGRRCVSFWKFGSGIIKSEIARTISDFCFFEKLS